MFCQITTDFSVNVNNFPSLKLHRALLKTSLQLALKPQKGDSICFINPSGEIQFAFVNFHC